QAANPGDHFKPGTSVRVELIARTVPNALVIPQAALLTSGSGATSVVVIDAENKPHKKSVTTGIRDAGSVQITDGLESGQRVVTTGAFELAKLESDVLAKTKVQIQPPKEEEEEEPDTPVVPPASIRPMPPTADERADQYWFARHSKSIIFL